MKKLLSFALALTLVLAMAVPVLASGVLRIEVIGRPNTGFTLIVYENDVEIYRESISNSDWSNGSGKFNHDVTVNLGDGRTISIGKNQTVGDVNEELQSSANPPHVCNFVKTFIGVDGVAVAIQNVPGNTNPYAFVITEEYADFCECGEQDGENYFEYVTFNANLNNNFEGTVNFGGYTVYINSKGNTQVRALYIVG